MKKSLEELQAYYFFMPVEAKEMEETKKRSFPAAERARRRKVNKRARLSRKVNYSVRRRRST